MGNVTYDPDYVYNYLRHYDDIYGEKYLPAIVFVAVLMSMGLVGNSLVCFVYLIKFKPSTVRCFIIALAAFDLTNCFISCPFDIADMRYRYTFGTHVWMCKTMRIFVTFTSVSSALLLIPIAVDRYKKICTPFKPQMSIRTAKVAVAVCILIGAVVAAPAAVMWGPRTVETDNSAINGSDCSTPDRFVGTRYPLFYNGFNLLVFLASTVSLVVIYSMIWCRVRKQVKYRNSVSVKSSSSDGPSNTITSTSFSSNSAASKHESSSSGTVKTGTLEGKSSNGDSSKHGSSAPKSVKSGKAKGKSSTKASKGEKGVRKTTFMLFLITLVFILSFLPHLSLMAVRALHKEIFDKLNNLQFGAFYFFFKSYFINSAFNPIIYSFCNPNFKKELANLILKCRCRK